MSARLLAAAILLVSSSAFGQALTVQQPVIESFSAGASVSVPAGGGALVGGVGRARTVRSTSGPLPNRGTASRSLSASSIAATATVHDLRMMDAAVFEAERRGSAPRAFATKGRYDDPTSYAMSKRRGAVARKRRIAPFATPRPVTASVPAAGASSSSAYSAEFDSNRLLFRGKEKEHRGSRDVAAIHDRLAAMEGPAIDRRRLDAIGKAEPGVSP